MSSNLISDYIGHGTHASRPATPSVPAGGTAIYTETDTGNTFIWNGSAWVQLNSTAGSIVQAAAAAYTGTALQGVTLGTAPTAGNVLVGIACGQPSTSNTGWHASWVQDSSGTTYTRMFWKIAGASEPTTQNPISAATTNNAIVVYELTPKLCPTLAIQDFNNNTASKTIPCPNPSSNGILIGFAYSEVTNTAVPTGLGIATQDAQAVGTVNSITAFHVTSPSVQQAVTLTWGALTNTRCGLIFCG